MSSLPIKNTSGQDVGSYELSDDLLESEKGLHAMQLAVTIYLGNPAAGQCQHQTQGRSAR